MTVPRTGSATVRRRLLAGGIVLAAMLPTMAWGQAMPAPNTATPLLPPTRQFSNPTVQSEPLAPPPGVASPSLTGPGSPSETTPGAAPATGATVPGNGAPPPNAPQTGPGQQTPAEAAPSPNPWVPKQAAVIQVLDKPDAESRTLTVKVGGSATYRSLTIAVQACMVRPPDVPQNATAFLVITDSHPEQPGFKGWMFANDPSLNMLQNPIYDVRVKGCTP